jgi:carboxyl-terminal processing protease
MKMKSMRRLLWCALSTVVLCALLGGLYGRQVEATGDGNDESDVQASLKAFTRVYNVVEQNYADPVGPDRAIYGPANSGIGAIPGMLRTLDPHSNFFDPRAFQQLREDQEGKYFGVGMTIQQRLNKIGKLTTVVVLPLPGSPAFRAGLRPGDTVTAVDGKLTDGLSIAQVADLLRGPKGTAVRVSISRDGSDEPLEFTITRDEISRRSVDQAFMIRPGVGYLHIGSFSETTNDELTEGLSMLERNGLKGMILDLRNNPGGLLQEAVDVSDHFLDKNQLIVYHYGRRSKEKRYHATKGETGEAYPLVVLINRQTASAAEIVTGALQDHDRALVMGEPSFGKGLVQTVYPLSEHAGLALTTARYYTPSGRLIQRDYSSVSLYDYYYHPELSPPAHNEVKLTDGGREVYGGGGITPDVEVSDPKMNPVEEKLSGRGVFFDFGKAYLGVHQTVPRDFQVDDAVLDEFKRYAQSEGLALSDQEIQDNLQFIKDHIRLQLIGVIYGENEAQRINIESDPLILKAVDSLPQAAQLLANARRYMASKGAAGLKE